MNRKGQPVDYFISCLCRGFVLTLLLASRTVLSQNAPLPDPQPHFRNFSQPHGLPSSETYFVLQDKRGFVWFATDRGVVRYNGYRFEKFTIADGLGDNVIFRIYEDFQGRVWFVSMNSMLSYFENGKIHLYRYNDKILKALGTPRYVHKELYVSPDGSIRYAIRGWGYLTISKNGKADLSHLDRKEDKILIYKEQDSYHIDSRISLETMAKSQVPELPVYLQKNGKAACIGKVNAAGDVRATGNRYGLFLVTSREIRFFDGEKLQQIPVTHPVISCYLEDRKLWIGYASGGADEFEILPGRKGLRKLYSYLKGYSVSSIFREKEGGYWFSTLEQGIFYTPTTAIFNWEEKAGLDMHFITDVNGIGNNVFVRNSNGNYLQLNPPWESERNAIAVSATTLTRFGNQLILPYTYKAGWGLSEEAAMLISTAKCARNVKDGVVLFSPQRRQIIQIHRNGSMEVLYNFAGTTLAFPFYITCFEEDPEGRLLVGTDLGIMELKNLGIKPYKPGQYYFGKYITGICSHPDLGLLIATKNDGLFCYRYKKLTHHFTRESGLLINSVNTIYLDEDNRLWISTHAGITILLMRFGKTDFIHATTDNGLPSNEVAGVYVNKGTAWITSKRGVSRMDIRSYLSARKTGFLFPEYIETSQGKIRTSAKKSVLRSDEAFVKLVFGTTNFRSSVSHNFRYRTHPAAEWIYTDIPEIILNEPAPGDYRLEVCFTFRGGKWSAPVVMSEFSIPEPFYATWYFTAFMIVLFLALVYSLFRLRLRQVKSKHKLITTITELEQKALSAQMNPHFIFNSLNSIQSFLVYEENDKAEKYLIKFSSLIRKTLTNSREKYIRIEQELSTLYDYLELESMRFSGKFVYEIECGLTTSEKQFFIPPMLIQPYVENAIIHGIAGMESGKIIISFQRSGTEQLLISIEDNGRGRAHRDSRKKGAHRSFGTTITQERLRFFTLSSGGDFAINVIDKTTAEGRPSGTRIELTIPILKAYESAESNNY